MDPRKKKPFGLYVISGINFAIGSIFGIFAVMNLMGGLMFPDDIGTAALHYGRVAIFIGIAGFWIWMVYEFLDLRKWALRYMCVLHTVFAIWVIGFHKHFVLSIYAQFKILFIGVDMSQDWVEFPALHPLISLVSIATVVYLMRPKAWRRV